MIQRQEIFNIVDLFIPQSIIDLLSIPEFISLKFTPI